MELIVHRLSVFAASMQLTLDAWCVINKSLRASEKVHVGRGHSAGLSDSDYWAPPCSAGRSPWERGRSHWILAKTEEADGVSEGAQQPARTEGSQRGRERVKRRGEEKGEQGQAVARGKEPGICSGVLKAPEVCSHMMPTGVAWGESGELWARSSPGRTGQTTRARGATRKRADSHLGDRVNKGNWWIKSGEWEKERRPGFRLSLLGKRRRLQWAGGQRRSTWTGNHPLGIQVKTPPRCKGLVFREGMGAAAEDQVPSEISTRGCQNQVTVQKGRKQTAWSLQCGKLRYFHTTCCLLPRSYLLK